MSTGDFPRRWPECRAGMDLVIGHLLSLGAEDDEVLLALMTDFPDLPSFAHYNNPLQLEKMRRERPIELVNVARRRDGLPAWAPQLADEPTEYELYLVTCAEEVLLLCRLYDLHVRRDPATGELVVSRKVIVGNPFWVTMKTYKAGLVALLEQSPAAAATVS